MPDTSQTEDSNSTLDEGDSIEKNSKTEVEETQESIDQNEDERKQNDYEDQTAAYNSSEKILSDQKEQQLGGTDLDLK